MTTYQFNIVLEDYEFFALENALNRLCNEVKEETGIECFDPITQEPRHVYGQILTRMKESIKNMELRSTSSFIPK
jgi:hypothetical protein